MTNEDLQKQLIEMKRQVHDLQQELDVANKGLIAVHIELEQRIEAEKREKEERVEELERELCLIENLGNVPDTSISAAILGSAPLKESQPGSFQELVQSYENLLEQALETRTYRVEYDIPGNLLSLAEQLGFFKAGPRDVVDIHNTAMQRKTKGKGEANQNSTKSVSHNQIAAS